MGATYPAQNITTGAEVFGSDGAKVGNVAAVYPAFIVVEKGFFFPTDYYVPRSAIGAYDADRILLNVSKDAALESGWDVQPADLDMAEYAGTEMAGAIETAIDAPAAARIGTEEEIRIPVMEEELTATVRSNEAGAVRVAKDVVTEERTLEVPVTEERLRIERRVVDRPASADDLTNFEETVIEVPLRTETVDVSKEARVAEEVVLSKEAVQHTERISDTVRKEQVHVEEDGSVTATNIDAAGAAGSSAP